ncbi:MAG: ABC transporter permease [Chloroflexota bacterium]|nr:ABC transporter permease [Chloroflexota bacterium]
MRNLWLVSKYEVITTLKRPSFWIMTFLMPALLFGIQFYGALQDSDLDLGSADADKTEGTSAADMPVIGLVDEAGLISEMPVDFPTDLFQPYADEATARVALEADEIEQYVHIPADYVATGDVTVYDKNFQILASGEDMGAAFHSTNEWMLAYLINLNLTGDAQLVDALRNPIPAARAERHVINPPVETDESVRALAKIVASVMPYMFYFILLVGSSYLLRSVTAEKENRTVEVLLLSLHPRQLMMGKVLGLSVVTLVQLSIWFGGGALILNRGTALLNVSGFIFPPGFIAWAILFLALGFLLFASVMAAAGAIAPTAREGNQVIWLLVLPLIPTLMFSQLFAEEPGSPLVLVLSLFPFSAPSAMVTRLALGEVPLWQVIAGLAGLALTTYLFILLAARFFRADNLLSDASFNWRRLAAGWRE